MYTLMFMMNLLLMMMSALMAMAFYTLTERKFLGYMQFRKGPNKPSIMALAVPMGDAGKLFSKEEKNTMTMNMMHYSMAPMMMIILSLMLWPTFPYHNSLFFLKFGILYFLSITSMSIYATFLAGWGSNSKWALFGALRGIAQTISYEMSMALIMICFITPSMSTNILSISKDHYTWSIILMLPLSVMWLISALAEMHRTPFDFTEGESELVSGFNVEYENSRFALIFMAEYMNILLMSLITVSVMMNSFSSMDLVLKTTMLSFMFIWARGTMPRLRYDILMDVLWKKILPLSLMFMLMMIAIMMMTS